MTYQGAVIPFSHWQYVLVTLHDSRNSFVQLSRWLDDVRALASPHLVTVLVGNKSDKENVREVEWAEAGQWAFQNGLSI